MMQMCVESRTVNINFKFIKQKHKGQESLGNEKVIKCSELPAPVLNDILGAAFNSRFVNRLDLETHITKKLLTDFHIFSFFVVVF